MDKKSKKYVFKSKYIDESYSKEGRKEDSNFYRRHLSDKKVAYIQFLVKNIDQLIIMSSIVDPIIRLYFIDRVLVFSHYHGIHPVIMISKTDKEADYPEVLQHTSKEIVDLYKNIGYEIYAFSNVKDTPIDLVKDILRDKRTALIGHSGVGKTSLLNQVDETYQQKIQEVSSFNQRGKHTTTKIRMHELNFGGVIYDMPGLKEMNFTTLSKRELARYFPDFLDYLDGCQFRDCHHFREEDCSVKKAVKKNEISPLRYQTYIEILQDLPIN